MVLEGFCRSNGIRTTILSTTFDPPKRESERNLSSLYTMGILVGLAIVTMTFIALVLAFILRSEGKRTGSPSGLPSVLWFSSAILILSSVTLETARRRLVRHDRPAFHRLAIYAVLLGVLFLAGQVSAWFQLFASGVVLAGNPHSGFIVFFTGIHGAHIFSA